jgi:hypothetical protein
MWFIFARAPAPDARVWPGRRALALADAFAWPMFWANVVLGLPMPLGLAGQCVLVICGVAALRRVHRAVTQNHRYHFTTWRWGRWVVLALASGNALKLAAMFSA